MSAKLGPTAARILNSAAAETTALTPGPPASTTPVMPALSIAASPGRTTAATSSSGTDIEHIRAIIGTMTSMRPPPANGPGPVLG